MTRRTRILDVKNTQSYRAMKDNLLVMIERAEDHDVFDDAYETIQAIPAIQWQPWPFIDILSLGQLCLSVPY